MRKPTMRRTDLMDTTEWGHRQLVKMLRQMTPEQRLRMALEATEVGRQMSELAQKRRTHG